MADRIPADHPLRELFSALVDRSLERHLGLRAPHVARYLGDVLVEFSHHDRLYAIRDAHGRSIDEVAEMMVEGDVALNATSFERERAVHKHIGDFTLFWTGVYPEMLRKYRAPERCDHLIDYVEQGRASYRIASTFEYGQYAEEAPLLRELSERFDACRTALTYVRRELDGYGTAETRSVQRLLQA